MSLESGSSLFGNRKSLPSDSSPGSEWELAHTLEDLNERVIILCEDDIDADASGAPRLDWSAVDKGEIAVQLKDIEGLADGSVTIRASTLQRIHPALLPIRVEAEYLFPISLKTVVLQVQPLLRLSSRERAEPVTADFDTPIAQVAREDEGYFKLAKVAEPREAPVNKLAQFKRKSSGPILTPADRPLSRIEPKKLFAEHKDSGFPLCLGAMTPPPLPSARPETEVAPAERGGPKIKESAQNSLRRIGQERLREIFMTDDQLDPAQVANRMAAFPKVCSAMVILGDGTVLGGNVPDGYRPEAALLVPVIMRSVQEFNRKLRSNETSAFTLLGQQAITLFAEGNIYVLISHEGRGLLPGVRERIGEVARALDALC